MKAMNYFYFSVKDKFMNLQIEKILLYKNSFNAKPQQKNYQSESLIELFLIVEQEVSSTIWKNMKWYHIIKQSLRCFLMARQIRENSLGEDTADVATTYNNIACCFYCLERNKEAIAYFQLSQAIFEAELGIFHSRTAIAK